MGEAKSGEGGTADTGSFGAQTNHETHAEFRTDGGGPRAGECPGRLRPAGRRPNPSRHAAQRSYKTHWRVKERSTDSEARHLPKRFDAVRRALKRLNASRQGQGPPRTKFPGAAGLGGFQGVAPPDQHLVGVSFAACLGRRGTWLPGWAARARP